MKRGRSLCERLVVDLRELREQMPDVFAIEF